MNKDELFETALEAGFREKHFDEPIITISHSNGSWVDVTDKLTEFSRMVEERERERCAKICESIHEDWKWDDEPDSISGPRECAEKIRSGTSSVPTLSNQNVIS